MPTTPKRKPELPKEDRKLDRALEETFPASDAVPSHGETGTEPLGSDPHRKAPRITKDQVADAAVDTVECPQCAGTGRLAKSKPQSSP